MVKLIWTDQAIDDLGDIGDYIAEKIYERTEILKNYPQAGRIVPEKNEENVRELIEGSYRIIYEINSEHLIHILAVYHSVRDLKY